MASPRRLDPSDWEVLAQAFHAAGDLAELVAAGRLDPAEAVESLMILLRGTASMVGARGLSAWIPLLRSVLPPV